MGSMSYAYDYRKPIDMAIEKCKVCLSANKCIRIYMRYLSMSNVEFINPSIMFI